MSKALEQIVDKAAKDETFRKLLLSSPDEALKDFNLTAEERQMLTNLNEDTFDAFAGTLGGRSTKGFLPGTG